MNFDYQTQDPSIKVVDNFHFKISENIIIYLAEKPVKKFWIAAWRI